MPRPKREWLGKVRFTHQAREDLINIWVLVAPQNPAAAARVYDRLEEGCRQLQDHPQRGPARPDIAEGARMLVIERWLVLYRLTVDGVQVVRIIDGARDLTKRDWTPD